MAASAPLPAPPLLAAPASMQPGDWVFRSGTGGESALIRQLSGGRYSHVGIVVQAAPRVLIAHAGTDEEPRHPNQVRLVPWEAFASRRWAQTLAVARPRFLDAAGREASARAAAARVGQAFELRPLDGAVPAAPLPLYCTTLLLEAVRAQAPAFAPAWQRLDVPLMRGDYLFPHALAEQDVQWLVRSE